jgi:hypothetical protein
VIICCAIFFHFFLFILYKLDLSFRDKFQNQISQQQQQQQSQPQINNNNQNRRNVEVKKKVWSVDTPDQQQQQQSSPPSPPSPPQTIYHTNGTGHYSSVQQQTNGIDVSRRRTKIFSVDSNLYIYTSIFFSIVKRF